MREYRELSPETRQKISQNQNLHKPRPNDVRNKISVGMRNYWKGVPNRPKTGGEMLRDGDIV